MLLLFFFFQVSRARINYKDISPLKFCILSNLWYIKCLVMRNEISLEYYFITRLRLVLIYSLWLWGCVPILSVISSCRLPLLMVSCTLEGFLKPSSQCSYVLFVFCNYSCIINVLNKFKHFLPLKNLFELILYDINQKCSLLHWVISLANLPSSEYWYRKPVPATQILARDCSVELAFG